MQKETVTFDKLPEAVGYLTEQVIELKQDGSGTPANSHQTNTYWLKLRMLAVSSEKPSLPFIHWYAKGCFLPTRKARNSISMRTSCLAWIENGRRKTAEQTYEEMLANMQEWCSS